MYTFLTLDHVLQMQCAGECDLIEPEDKLLDQTDKFIKWFQRAESRNMLAVFWDKIQTAKKEIS